MSGANVFRFYLYKKYKLRCFKLLRAQNYKKCYISALFYYYKLNFIVTILFLFRIL